MAWLKEREGTWYAKWRDADGKEVVKSTKVKAKPADGKKPADAKKFAQLTADNMEHVAKGNVRVEQRRIQFQNGDESGYAELADFEDVIVEMEILIKFRLRPVHFEALLPGILVKNSVQVIETPPTVGQQYLYFPVLVSRQFHESTGFSLEGGTVKAGENTKKEKPAPFSG